MDMVTFPEPREISQNTPLEASVEVNCGEGTQVLSRPQGPSMHSPTGLRVLVVSEGLQVGEVLEQVLTAEGHTVRVTHNARTVLDGILLFKPHIVILEVAEAPQVAHSIRQLADLRRPFLLSISRELPASRTAPEFDLQLALPLDRRKFLNWIQRLSDIVSFDPMI